MRDEDKILWSIIDIGIKGGLGYLLGVSKYKDWKQFINAFNERLGYMKYLQVIIPFKFFERSSNMKQVYSEGIYAYLYGLSNASLPLLLKCLEVGLKIKYNDIEKKQPNMKLFDLIGWSEKLLREKKEIAHGFRILRNLIHEEKIVREQDILEAIRHTSIILNEIFSLLDNVTVNVFCNNCKQYHQYSIRKTDYFIGNNVIFRCNKFKQNIVTLVMP